MRFSPVQGLKASLRPEKRVK